MNTKEIQEIAILLEVNGVTSPDNREKVIKIISDFSSSQKRRFTPPSAEEVEAYAKLIGYPIDGSAWVDFYSQKGWMIGSSKMKDWKAAVRTWKRNGWRYSYSSMMKANQGNL